MESNRSQRPSDLCQDTPTDSQGEHTPVQASVGRVIYGPWIEKVFDLLEDGRFFEAEAFGSTYFGMIHGQCFCVLKNDRLLKREITRFRYLTIESAVQRRLAELKDECPCYAAPTEEESKAALISSCRGFIHHNCPNGTTVPVSQVYQKFDGGLGITDMPPAEYSRNVKISTLKWKTTTGRSHNIMFGKAQLYVTDTELEALTDILIERRACLKSHPEK